MKKAKNSRTDSVKLAMAAIAGVGAVLATVLLAFRFYVMLYFPGTEQTAVLFKVFLPFWKTFSYICLILKSPMVYFVSLWQSHFPPEAHGWFPEMPAATLMGLLNHHPASFYRSVYPGKVEWVCLLAVGFWNILLLLIYQCFLFIRENMDLKEAMQESMVILSEHRVSQQIKNKLEAKKDGQKKNVQAGAGASQKEAADSRHADERTLQRLSQSKIQPVNMPPLVIKGDWQDWEQYKQEQGDLMVQDMVRQLKRENASLQAQQNQLRSTFSQYFSPTVLQYLETNKGTFQNVNNEKHMISVLFCDIRGFSAYSLSASPDEVVSFLGEYFEIASHSILHKHNGVISKLMGDGLMAYWGFPVPNEDHAYIATRAALDILHEVSLRNQTKPDMPSLNIGIGIATGEAIVGNIGSDDFKDFTLIGPSVNMAARLEEANKRQGTQLLISEMTYQALNGRVPCRDQGEIEIRGWQKPERIYAPEVQ